MFVSLYKENKTTQKLNTMKNLNIAQQIVLIAVTAVFLTALILSVLGVGGFTTSEFTNL